MNLGTWMSLAGLVAMIVTGGFYVGHVNGRLDSLSLDEIATAKEAALAEIAAATTVPTPIPDGAVVAFTTTSCPSGWLPYGPASGRFIVGVGRDSQYDRYGAEQPEFTAAETGGSRTHVLTVDEIPGHDHAYTFSSGNGSPQHIDYSANEFGFKDQTSPTSSTGGGQAHNNMPPYIALMVCTPGP